MAEKGQKSLAVNKKARFDYLIEDTFEAGMVLVGTEVKSIRQGKINIKEGYARIENSEIYLHNVHISPYEQGNIFNKDPLRIRKLLLHKAEIRKLIGYVQQKGYTLVPMKVYLQNGLVKLQLGVGVGKKLHDKRQDMAKKDSQRRIQKELGQRQKGME
ncbi:SsrA-binding protein [Alkaliphilus metalliredigens QYMF]|uniref:SsrA-binding protein n=1 Tax=Alkaliphilus metalliredigens (strain QYMF) TaxID=293826 RepID=SSRP_ALKMQ|nr:SsrA-binding protein SmpB [Alkaliphilus metalliredigens]A6TU24.1 RecName: Full=SsrA-binding protein; AltName: Full=Small protein B [Alkaliphilus metalliredigens QYMF]ABR49692.1 SsrA-binding protein [Alkaliphilus metalliredigens QYMF]